MELRHLRYFVTVADELSFTRAARKLNIAQPPLSQQIQDLEAELGLSLFDRSRRAIALTQAGREFYQDARAILAQVAKASERAMQSARGEVGQLSVAIISSVATTKFAAMLRAFQKACPGIRISLSDRPSGWQLRALERGTIDVGFLGPPARLSDAFERYVIKRDSMKLAVASGHPFAKRSHVGWSELKDESFILVDPMIVAPGYYSEFMSRCREAGFEPQVTQYTRNVATQVWMVSAGLGLAPMPLSPELDRSSGVTFIALPKNTPVYETAMVWKRGDHSPALNRFTTFVRERGLN